MDGLIKRPGSLITRFRAHLEEGESSDRRFGFLVSAAVFLLAGWRYARTGAPSAWVAGVGVAVLLAAILRPRVLRAPKRAWLFFGFLMGGIVSPVVLAILFYGVIAPAGWLMRRAGADPLRIRRPAGHYSYWIDRSDPASDMKDQF